MSARLLHQDLARIREVTIDRILITGGNGALGRVLVSKLHRDPDHRIRVMSRKPRPDGFAADLEWAQADLETGAGLSEAVAGVQTLIHAATNPREHTRQVDVQGTARLLDLARAAGVTHLVYISIVGVDRIPYSYYQSKLAAERTIEMGLVPWTILRATQFHDLLDFFLGSLTRRTIAPIPSDFKFQPVAIDDVADRLIECLSAGPSGRLPDVGGPEVLDGYAILYPWLKATQVHPEIVHIRLPGKIAEGFRHGYNTCPENRQGKTTWQEWLARRYSQPAIPGEEPAYSRKKNGKPGY